MSSLASAYIRPQITDCPHHTVQTTQTQGSTLPRRLPQPAPNQNFNFLRSPFISFLPKIGAQPQNHIHFLPSKASKAASPYPATPPRNPLSALINLSRKLPTLFAFSKTDTTKTYRRHLWNTICAVLALTTLSAGHRRRQCQPQPRGCLIRLLFTTVGGKPCHRAMLRTILRLELNLYASHLPVRAPALRLGPISLIQEQFRRWLRRSLS